MILLCSLSSKYGCRGTKGKELARLKVQSGVASEIVYLYLDA